MPTIEERLSEVEARLEVTEGTLDDLADFLDTFGDLIAFEDWMASVQDALFKIFLKLDEPIRMGIEQDEIVDTDYDLLDHIKNMDGTLVITDINRLGQLASLVATSIKNRSHKLRRLRETE
jgi:hypothetical protein